MSLAILTLLLICIFVVNILFRGNTYLASPECFVNSSFSSISVRFGSPPEWSLLGEGLQSPYASRMLFRFFLVGLVRLFNLHSVGIWLVFTSLNFIFSLLLTYSLFYFSRSVFRLRVSGAFLASFFYLISFTHIFAFEFPTWVFEDILGYVFLINGIVALSKRHYWLFQLCIVGGILTRENLLILLVAFWLYDNSKLRTKLAMTVPAILAFLIPRLLCGSGLYNPLDAGSIRNFQYPIESCGFLFATFGSMWIVAPIAWRNCSRFQDTLLSSNMCKMIILIIFLSTIIGGRLRETRLMFLAFPWIIIPSADYLSSLEWRRVNLKKVVLILCFVLLLFLIVVLLSHIMAANKGIGLGEAVMVLFPCIRDFIKTTSAEMIARTTISLYISITICIILSARPKLVHSNNA